MTEHLRSKAEVDQFVLNHIDTVPHLEALLLLWDSRPKPWSVQEMADGLYLTPVATRVILQDLMRHRLITLAAEPADTYWYVSDAARDLLVSALQTTYRQELIRLSRLIHSKAPAAVREFARAFRFKKEPE
ncbi:MAG: hypothetical protein ABI759_19110 [Candidatus Solibacter sp.]